MDGASSADARAREPAVESALAAGATSQVLMRGGQLYFPESEPLLPRVGVGECAHGRCLRAFEKLSSGTCLRDDHGANAFLINIPDAAYASAWTLLDVRLGSFLKHAAAGAEVSFTESLKSEIEALMNEPGHTAGAVSWQLAYLLAMRQEPDEHGICMHLMQGIEPFSESTLETMMWKLQPLDLFYFVVICQREWDFDECPVEEMWKRFVLLMVYPFTNAGGNCLILHKYICMANTADEAWKAFQDGSASPVSSANAFYWCNEQSMGLFILEDVDANSEITIDYGHYVMPVEKRLATRKRAMSADLLRLLLAVSSRISPRLTQKISEC